MTIPQLFSAMVGGLLGLVSLYVFAVNKTRRFKALFWLAIGAAMIFAAFRPRIIETLGPDSVVLRIRLVVALLSFIVLTVTLEAIRSARMQERYAFLWLATGSLLLAGSLFPQLGYLVEKVTGMSYGASVLVVVFTFILLMLFHISVALSRMQYKMAQIARELALAEERLRQMEQKKG